MDEGPLPSGRRGAGRPSTVVRYAPSIVEWLRVVRPPWTRRSSSAPPAQDRATGSERSDRAFRLLFCAVWIWLFCLYLVIVIPFDRLVPVLDRWPVAIMLVSGLFITIVTLVTRLDRRAPRTVLSVTLCSATSLVCLVGADVASSAYFNVSERFREPVADRTFDEVVWTGELVPHTYYPSDANFYLYKPRQQRAGYTYGELYYVGLLSHPILRDSVLRWTEVRFSIDQYGFRNTQPPERSRVFTLGDSFCFGFHVTQESIFQAHLARRLGEPVYNMGVIGTSPFQQLLLLEHVLTAHPESFRPQRILWLLFEGNDLEDDYASRRTSGQEGGALGRALRGTVVATMFDLPALIRRESLLQRHIEGRLILGRPDVKRQQADPYVLDGERIVYPLYRSARFGYKLFRPTYVTRAAQPESYVLNHPNRPRLNETFRRMQALAAQHHFAVTVVIVPSDARQYGHAFEDMPPISPEPHFINYLKRLSGEVGFSVVDLNQLMAPSAANELLFHRDGTHWNDRGHEVVADLLWRSVLR
jgi:GDSL-like Lipase/Acylhydrolase family